MRWMTLGIAVALFGCDARFQDRRPGPGIGTDGSFDASSPDGGSPDSGVLDSGRVDVGSVDAGLDDTGPDDTGPDDTGPDDTGLAGVLGRGAFDGRSGYEASGTATLESLGGDRYAVVLSPDFSSASVPGPVIVTTTRPSIGTALQDGDVLVARLGGAEIRGGGRHEITDPRVGEALYVFIYCEPFGVETARATLESP